MTPQIGSKNVADTKTSLFSKIALAVGILNGPGGVTGQYLGRDVRAPSPSPPRDRILKCTKTEEFSSLNGKKGAEAGFRSRVGGRAYVKCTGWSGVGCEWAEMAEIQKKQNPLR